MIIIMIVMYVFSNILAKNIKQQYFLKEDSDTKTLDFVENREKMISTMFKIKFNNDRNIFARNNKVSDESTIIENIQVNENKNLKDIENHNHSDETAPVSVSINESISDLPSSTDVSVDTILLNTDEINSETWLDISSEDDYLYEYREPLLIIPFNQDNDDLYEEDTNYPYDCAECINKTPFSQENNELKSQNNNELKIEDILS